ncbi:50S ribosomal protein L30e [Pyrodictium delaneyi]|uniref:Large ribosomal subunit protein eL30 n=1 Tax=Pyrodictium delaneyi TaxID=1273541 RepID=A0A0P0N2X0_9CREN|nr:50S ribosomal protein L30e [Pyrodictium delaneyi]ALL00490.1 50S ribosomal protein L30e [Pyrodictium delaneyi]OWJ53961.1 50S ribosomal protein L30e [Pyrodictium delaneyi]
MSAVQVTDIEKELVNALKTGKVILGSRKTLRYVKTGKAKAVIVAANAPPELRSDILYYAELSGIPVYVYPGTSVELGAVCGKPFTVASLAILDPGSSRILDLIEAARSKA